MKTNKIFKSMLFMIPVIIMTFMVSCEEDVVEEPPVEECTFESDRDCFCLANPDDAQCEEECTFESDRDCFCEANPDDAQCDTSQEDFDANPITYCFDNPDHALCTSILINGGFEDAAVVQGAIGDDLPGVYATEAGEWFFAGIGSRADYAIIGTDGEDGASGNNALEFTLTTNQANSWEQQLVNTQPAIEASKRYVMLVDVRADAAGRLVTLHGGLDGSRDDHNWWDFEGSTQFILAAGWNQVAIHMQFPLLTADEIADDAYAWYDVNLVDHVRSQVDFAFPENNTEGDFATFAVDNMRVIITGDIFTEASAEFCSFFPEDSLCVEE